MFIRPHATRLARRLAQRRLLIQVVAGPRQSGKTTLVRQVAEASRTAFHYASADEPTLRGRGWIEQQWDIVRLAARERRGAGALLILDEIQKIADWSETVKRLWDKDTAMRRPVKVVLLGSAPLLVQRGLTESLAGRFELINLPHWLFAEMREAFRWGLDRYLFFGGYIPVADFLAKPVEHWVK